MTSNPRMFLWIGLALLLWLNYETWNKDYAAKPAAATTSATAAQAPATRLDATIPQAAPAAGTPSSGTSTAASASPGAAPAPATADADGPATPDSAGTIHVVTDVLDVDIGLLGGELSRADLLQYPLVKGQSKSVRLLNRDAANSLYVIQTGLSGAAGTATPTHLARFTATQNEYRLATGAKELRVPLTWTDASGVTVTKTFVFRAGEYTIPIEYRIDNRSATPFAAAPYAQIQRDAPPVERSMFSVESYATKGPAMWDGAKYQKLALDDEENANLSLDVTGGWVAALEHHFVGAIVPPPNVQNRFMLRVRGNEFVFSAAGPMSTVAPGASGELVTNVFVGPKLQKQLTALSPELARVADYGLLTPLSKPLFILLGWLHGVVGNWGWAIIFATAILKLLFYPLSEASGKSMARMKALAPRIKNLQDTYKDDREKLGRAMMELYQREKVNPVSGCLPILIQMPVFLAFYWVLLESVEMRQAPFLGWLNDLSSKDPFFILPAIMAGAMFLQYKLNPTPPDPVQAKVFMFMPLVMSAMFAFFPSGLVLYWVTNTVLSIAQQWNINRRIEAAATKKAA